MAALTVLMKYAKTLRSKLAPYPTRFSLLALLLLFGLFQSEALLPVSAQNTAHSSNPQNAVANDPPGGTQTVTVQVPASMQSAPFNVTRTLNIPPNFSISVYARVGGVRFMAVTPSGDLLVSNPGAGSIYIVRPNSTAGGDPVVTTFVSGLHNPHDMVFHAINSTTYLYVSESNQIDRYVYTYGVATVSNKQVVVANLPDASSSDLHGVYGHQLKNIAIDSNDKLYVAISSRSNADTSAANGDPQDGSTNPIRASIYQYNANDGTGGVRFAGGLRNAEGLAFVPGTNTLWVAVNNRDNIACPNNGQTIGGCSPSNIGSVVQSYVNNHPPEEFTKVTQNANYGWPFCNPNPDSGSGMDNMPFDRDQQNNPNNTAPNCSGSAVTRINKGIQAHSAPLGLTFLQDTAFPTLYRSGVVIGLHGSWNRTPPTGYKVIYFPWDSATQTPGSQVDLVSGWLLNDNSVWGRPVEAVVGLDGSMFISDDNSGTIYRLAPYLHVTSSSSDSSSGTVANVLSKARFGDKIVFDDTLGSAPLTLNITTNIGTIWKGVTIDGGSCSSGPHITLNGSGATGDGPTLNGGISLKNIGIQGFPGKQLIINHSGGVNKFGPCVVIRK